MMLRRWSRPGQPVLEPAQACPSSKAHVAKRSTLGRAIDAALMRSMMPKIPFSIWMLIAVVIGILIRLALIIPSGWRMDYDEAMVGLLGLRVLRGEFMAFIPAQATLGAIEPYLLAPLFGLLGATPL